jgi:hypothetical protein
MTNTNTNMGTETGTEMAGLTNAFTPLPRKNETRLSNSSLTIRNAYMQYKRVYLGTSVSRSYLHTFCVDGKVDLPGLNVHIL